jgi:hypothetical protein
MFLLAFPAFYLILRVQKAKPYTPQSHLRGKSMMVNLVGIAVWFMQMLALVAFFNVESKSSDGDTQVFRASEFFMFGRMVYLLMSPECVGLSGSSVRASWYGFHCRVYSWD